MCFILNDAPIIISIERISTLWGRLASVTLVYLHTKIILIILERYRINPTVMKHIFPFILLLFLLSTVPSCNSSLITMEEKPDSSITLTDDFRVTLDMARSFAASIKERGPIESEECFSFRGDTEIVG